VFAFHPPEQSVCRRRTDVRDRHGFDPRRICRRARARRRRATGRRAAAYLDAAKAADKCQKAILTGGASFTEATLKGLTTCFDGVFKCAQTKPGNDGCIVKAIGRCAKENGAARAKRVAKLTDAVTRKCASIDDLRAMHGLGYGVFDDACAAAGGIALADCVREALECRAERMVTVEIPRARGLADAPQAPSAAAAKRAVVQAIEAAADRLGNTVAVCRKCYVHPAVLEAYLDGDVIGPARPRAARAGRLSADEAAVARLIARRTRSGRRAVKKAA